MWKPSIEVADFSRPFAGALRQSASGAECGRLAREALKCRDASIAGLADFHSTQDHACRIALKCMPDETGVKPAPPLKPSSYTHLNDPLKNQWL
ncbi:hypothetical protein, partial [Ralstonia solanacearum]